MTLRYPFIKWWPVTSTFQEHKDRKPPSTAPGLDIAVPKGMPILAVADGVVTWSRYTSAGGRGLWLWHKALNLESYYAHLEAACRLQGETVKAGDMLGLVGSTGHATGPHLHLSIRKGKEWLDPEPLLEEIQPPEG